MSDNLVYGKTECTTFHDGAKVRVHIDEAWDADDPFVKARPDLFTEAPVKTQQSGPAKRGAARKSAAKS